MSEAQRSKKVTGVSKVSKMSKQGEQQSLHSLLPLGEGGRRPDEGLKETARCNSDEMLKQVQHDGISHVKETNLTCPPLETLPSTNNPVDCLCERKPEFLIPRRGTKNYDETSHKATEPASCNSLVPQCLVLDLLHARRVSPVVLTHKSAQSARYPDVLTSFAPSVRKSASNLVPYW